MNYAERKHIKQLYDRLLCTSSVCLCDKNNLFARLRSDERHRTIAAFVSASEFTHNFELIGMPLLERVIKLYDEYAVSTPEVLHLEGHAYIEDFRGTQYADFNIRTLELVFTHYNVQPSCMFTPCKGKGKIPLDEDGYFSMEGYVPMN